MTNYLVIENVAVPIVIDDTFIAPDLERAIRYYPEFVRFSKSNWSVQAYLCAILKEIDKIKPNGYDGDSVFKEFIHYIGFEYFGKLMSQKIVDIILF